MGIDIGQILYKALIISIKDFWWLYVIIGVIIFGKIFFEILLPDFVDAWRDRRRFRQGMKWRSERELLQWLRSMSPTEFERYVAELFTRLGYKAEAVGRSHDGGIDVIAEKDGVKNYIQCKKFITSEVTVGAMRDFYGALADHLANGKGYFITTNKFTLEAQRFAEDKPIELVDGFGLVRYIRLAEKESPIKPKVEMLPPACPKCGGVLVKRSGKFGSFYGCSNYPKCDYTINTINKL